MNFASHDGPIQAKAFSEVSHERVGEYRTFESPTALGGTTCTDTAFIAGRDPYERCVFGVGVYCKLIE